MIAKYPASVRAGMSRSVPLQRLGTVAEHAWLVALLASPLGRAFNGSTVTLDGARDNWFGPVAAAGARRRVGRGAGRGAAVRRRRYDGPDQARAGEVLWLHRSLPSF